MTVSTNAPIPAESEWRDGWTLVLATSSGMFVAAMAVYSASVFIIPLEKAYGWSRAQISAGLTIFSVVTMIGTPLIGILVDRWGPRRVALPGTALYLAAFGLLGLAGPGIWSWYAIRTFLSLASLGTKTNVYAAAVASRFTVHRGLALGLSLAGVGIALSIIPPLANAFVQHFGVRFAYAAIAGATAVFALPLMWRFFYGAGDRPGSTRETSGLGWREALRSSIFFRLALASILVSTAMTAIAVHMVPMFVSRGLTATAAAGFAGAVGVASLVGRVSSGWLVDRLPPAALCAAIFSLPIVASALLLHFDGSIVMALVIASLFGFALGGEVDIIAYLASRLFGMRNFGTLFGVISGLLALGAGLGPLAAGAIYDANRSYDLLLFLAMPAMAVGAICVATLGISLSPRAAGKTLQSVEV